MHLRLIALLSPRASDAPRGRQARRLAAPGLCVFPLFTAMLMGPMGPNPANQGIYQKEYRVRSKPTHA